MSNNKNIIDINEIYDEYIKLLRSDDNFEEFKKESFSKWRKIYHKSDIFYFSVIYTITLIALLILECIPIHFVFFLINGTLLLIFVSLTDYTKFATDEEKNKVFDIIDGLLKEYKMKNNQQSLRLLRHYSKKVGSKEFKFYNSLRENHLLKVIKGLGLSFLAIISGYIGSMINEGSKIQDNISEYTQEIILDLFSQIGRASCRERV